MRKEATKLTEEIKRRMGKAMAEAYYLVCPLLT